MSRPELSLFSYEVMGLVGRDGAGPHDLLRMARRGRLLDWAGESQYYVEPKRLAKLGYLEARSEPGPHPPADRLRAHRARAWRRCASTRRTPVTVTPLKSEPLLRLLIADLVGEELTRESLQTLRADLDDLRARLDESEAAAKSSRTARSTSTPSTPSCAPTSTCTRS